MFLLSINDWNYKLIPIFAQIKMVDKNLLAYLLI